MLTPYAPASLAQIDARYRSGANPPAWVGMDVWGAAICFNTVEAQKQKLPGPTSGPIWPNPSMPARSSCRIRLRRHRLPRRERRLQMMGEQKGWAYMDALHQNIGQYTHSGSKPCKMAATGEFPIGISFEYRAVKTKKEGAPIDIVLPSEGTGWDIEATAIVKGTKNLDAAGKLADFSASPAAMALYEKNFAVTAMPGVAKPDALLPADYEKRLIKNDFARASANRDRVLAEWSKRYDGKSEKK